MTIATLRSPPTRRPAPQRHCEVGKIRQSSARVQPWQASSIYLDALLLDEQTPFFPFRSQIGAEVFSRSTDKVDSEVAHLASVFRLAHRGVHCLVEHRN